LILKRAARNYTAAFRSPEIGPAFREALAETLDAQENVAEFAKKTIRNRETLYRIFSGPRTPRLSTILSVLDAAGLCFGVRGLSRKNGRG
jgi:DNA-binding phage protein